MKLLFGKYYSFPLESFIHNNMHAWYDRMAVSLFYRLVEHFFYRLNRFILDWSAKSLLYYDE